MTRKFWLIVWLLLPMATLYGVQAQPRKVPAEVADAFKAKYPNTSNADWKERQNVFQVNYEMDDVRYASRFTSKGEWIETEKELEEDQLPAEVKDGYSKSKFTDWELKRISWVQSKASGVQYRLFVRKNGLEKKYLYFDKTGRFIRDAASI
ncbi:MAG TPA: PepSY-like domain-containing protein [Chitinophagaceae bacterium]|nr:PepSY-like domain-containing protein [Chitinophagaceae bacterium]